MESVSSRNTSPEQPSVRPVTRTILGSGQGIRLLATCLLGSPSSQMGVCEIYEWLAEKYPQYQYNKNQIRHVLHRDSKRKNPRFMVANEYRIFQALIWNNMEVPEFKWESWDRKEIARLPIKELTPFMKAFEVISQC
jgi:hypothetical protein